MILVVEDDPGVTALEERTLIDAGYEVCAVATGKEALAALNCEPIRLVLLDYRLPDMTGLDILESMGERTTTVPVIVVTGYQDSTLEERVLSHGARRMILKDGGLTFLQRIVEAVATEWATTLGNQEA